MTSIEQEEFERRYQAERSKLTNEAPVRGKGWFYLPAATFLIAVAQLYAIAQKDLSTHWTYFLSPATILVVTLLQINGIIQRMKKDLAAEVLIYGNLFTDVVKEFAVLERHFKKDGNLRIFFANKEGTPNMVSGMAEVNVARAKCKVFWDNFTKLFWSDMIYLNDKKELDTARYTSIRARLWLLLNDGNPFFQRVWQERAANYHKIGELYEMVNYARRGFDGFYWGTNKKGRCNWPSYFRKWEDRGLVEKRSVNEMIKFTEIAKSPI